jgi:hypothetical protein
VGRLAHLSHPGGRTSSSGISTAVTRELPAGAGADKVDGTAAATVVIATAAVAACRASAATDTCCAFAAVAA